VDVTPGISGPQVTGSRLDLSQRYDFFASQRVLPFCGMRALWNPKLMLGMLTLR
jgi:hypothetical protein